MSFKNQKRNKEMRKANPNIRQIVNGEIYTVWKPDGEHKTKEQRYADR